MGWSDCWGFAGAFGATSQTLCSTGFGLCGRTKNLLHLSNRCVRFHEDRSQLRGKTREATQKSNWHSFAFLSPNANLSPPAFFLPWKPVRFISTSCSLGCCMHICTEACLHVCCITALSNESGTHAISSGGIATIPRKLCHTASGMNLDFGNAPYFRSIPTFFSLFHLFPLQFPISLDHSSTFEGLRTRWKNNELRYRSFKMFSLLFPSPTLSRSIFMGLFILDGLFNIGREPNSSQVWV